MVESLAQSALPDTTHATRRRPVQGDQCTSKRSFGHAPLTRHGALAGTKPGRDGRRAAVSARHDGPGREAAARGGAGGAPAGRRADVRVRRPGPPRRGAAPCRAGRGGR